MAVKRLAVKSKIGSATQRPSTAPQQKPVPANGALASDRTPTFDPRSFLSKLASGKSTQEYRASESVFSQGEAADSVFYIQSGKVKLAVVSKRGREAVIAILPEGSFFWRGLPGWAIDPHFKR